MEAPCGACARRGFVEALLALPDRSLELGLDAVDMIGDALDQGALTDLAEWEIAAHPGVYAFPIGADRFLTASIASEAACPWFTWNAAADPRS